MSAPRLVLVYRASQLAELMAQHSTMAAVEFFLETRGQSVTQLIRDDEQHTRTMSEIANVTPLEWRQTSVERTQLSRFLFEPDDTIVVVGQDGLVANVAKYLDHQPVLGVNPQYPGQLCHYNTTDVQHYFAGSVEHTIEDRYMVEARVDDGQVLTALNEVFIGDKGHQSARYLLSVDQSQEEQSSSGLIVGTGTGATGWLASLWLQTRPRFQLPTIDSANLAYFVREAWPSQITGTDLVAGLLSEQQQVQVRAQSPLVVFGDGIERDRLRVEWGQSITVQRSTRRLRLVRMAHTAG